MTHSRSATVLFCCATFFIYLSAIYLKFQPLDFYFMARGLDPSWQAALATAMEDGRRFGSDIVFTGGPLASLYNRFFQSSSSFLPANLSLAIVVYIASCFTTLSMDSRNWSRTAIAAVIIIACILQVDTVLMMIPVMMAFCNLRSFSQSYWIIGPVGAFLSATAILAKFSVLPIALVCVLVLDVNAVSARRIPIHTLTLAIGLVVLFSLTGQSVSDFPSFMKGSFDVVSGYSSAMSLPMKPTELIMWLLVTFLFCVLAIVDTYGKFSRREPVASYVSKFIVLLAFLFIGFKAGFVRHDLHSLIAWSTLSVALALHIHSWNSGPEAKRSTIGLFPYMAFASLIPSYVLIGLSIHAVPVQGLGQLTSTYLRSAGMLWQYVSNPNGWQQGKSAEQSKAIASIAASIPLVKLDGTVDVLPSVQSDVIANGLNYKPRPTIQEYTTYNPALIERNREYFLGSEAPKYLFFAPGSIDNRHPASAEGALWPIFLSKYEPVGETQGLLILRERANKLKDVLGPSTEIRATIGEKIAVPNTSEPSFISIDLRPNFVGKVLELFYRPPIVTLTVNYDDQSTAEYRLIPGMARDGFVISPLVNTIADYLNVSAGQTGLKSAKRPVTISVSSGTAGNFAYRQEIDFAFRTIDSVTLAQGSTNNEFVRRALQFIPYLEKNSLKAPMIALAPEGLFAHAPSNVRLHVDAGKTMSLTFGIRDGAWQGPVVTDGVCFFVKGSTGVLFQRCLDPLNVEGDRGVQSLTVKIPDGNGDISLETTCVVNCSWDWSYWGKINLY